MIIVKARYDDFIEGYINDESEFFIWLKEHNQQRDKDSQETIDDFDFIQIIPLIKRGNKK